MRMPNTLNHKYASGPKPVKVISAILNLYKSESFKFTNELSQLEQQLEVEIDIASFKPPEEGPRQLWAKVRNRVPRPVASKFDVVQPDRSSALWALMLNLFRAGFSRDEVFWVARESANNKFRDNKYHADLDLWKDVLRAERNLRSPATTDDIKQRINDARRLSGLTSEKRLYIAGMVRDDLAQSGTFMATNDNQEWYIREDTGRPVSLSVHSEFIGSLLETRYGLNPVEPEQRYTINHLMAMTRERGQRGATASLSYYDKQNETLLVHNGRKDVSYVTGNSISTINNGNLGIVFPWIADQAPFDPVPTDASYIDRLFDGCFDNIEQLTPKQAIALLKAWMWFILFRDDARTRPLMVFLGAPGCLSGDTPLEVKRGLKGGIGFGSGQHTRFYSIKEVYNSFNGYFVGKGRTPWDRSIPTYLKSVKNGLVEWLPVKNVVKSGKKVTYAVAVGSRPPFRATLDHRFLTPSGYKPLKDLSVGDKVITRGRAPFLGRLGYTRRTIAANYHPYARQKVIAGRTYGSILYCRAVLEAALNDLSTKEYLSIVHTKPNEVESLKLLPKDVVIHHKDENPENDVLDNLEAMTKLEHDRISAIQQNELCNGHWLTEEESITSIEFYGEEETFDIEMEDQTAPNFMVQNVAVHNSGKTTLFERIYAVFYGMNKSLTMIDNADNYRHIASHDPLVVFDNVDNYYTWLPDALALSASNHDLSKRKLYTDTDEITLRMQAVVGITSHNPKFLREDVVDRMIILNFKRFELLNIPYKTETNIIDNIIRNRDKYWGALLNGAQAILNTPDPAQDDIPRFRVSDFARIGLRIARAMGFEQDFISAITANKEEQVTLNKTEDALLIETLVSWSQRTTPRFCTAADLWEELLLTTADDINFRRAYKSSVLLGKKLFTLEDTLSSMFVIEHDTNITGTHSWKFTLSYASGR